MLKKLLVLALLFSPLAVSAQVFGQNQVILSPFGSNGFVVSTTTGNSSKLSATSTPFFANFFATNGNIKNLTVNLSGLLKGNSSSAVTAAANGTDYTLIIAKVCSAGDFVSSVTAAGVFTCTTPAGTTYTATYPVQVTGSVISLAFGTTTTNTWVHQIFSSLFATNASTTNATSSTLAITGAAANCNGVNALTTNSIGVVGCTAQPQGTITAVSVASANGFAGSSSGGATPALTLTTTITGVLKGNGTAISAGANGTDYTLITAKVCSAGDFVSTVTAAGVFTCTTPAGTTYTATYPVTLTGSAFGLAFGTTTSNTWAGTQTFTNLITGSISGNAGTATALASNGTNCSAGYFPLGVDASGSSETCTYAFATSSPWSNSGLVGINASGQGYTISTTSLNASISGSAGSVANALTINNAGSGVASGGTFNGSSAVTISYNSIGAVPTTRNVNTTFPLQSGGALSGDLTLTSAFSTTSNSGMSAGNLYVGTGGIFQTAASSSIFGYTPLNPTRALTVAGTANQVTSSAGAQDLSADRTWTLSLPSHVIFPGNFQVTNSTTTNATTTGSSYFSGITASRPLYVDSTGKLTSAGSGTSGNCVNWGANNTLGDAGAACGSGGGGSGVFPFSATTNFGQVVYATSTPTLWFQSGLFASSTSRMHELLLGSTTPQSFTNAPLVITGDVNAYTQTVLQNLNAGTTASADFIVGGDLMTNSKYYGDLGYNSSANTDSNYTGFGANAFYLYNTDGDVDFATASTTNVGAALRFFTAGTLAANERMRITSAGNVGIGSTTPWGLLSVASSTWNSALPLFSISTSTDSAGQLVNVYATSTSQVTGAGIFVSGVRMVIGYLSSAIGSLDQLFVNGRINTGDWHDSECNAQLVTGTSVSSGDVLTLCNGWGYQADTQGLLDVEPTSIVATSNGGNANATNGVTSFAISVESSSPGVSCTSVAATNSGAGLFAGMNSVAKVYGATSTPSLEVVAKIACPGNATSSSYYIGVSNLNPSGTTFETDPTTGCYFIASSTEANWKAMCRTSSTVMTIVDTGFASTTVQGNGGGAWYRFRLDMDANGATFTMASSTAPLKTVARITATYPGTTAMQAIGLWMNTTAAGLAKVMVVSNARFWWQTPALNYSY